MLGALVASPLGVPSLVGSDGVQVPVAADRWRGPPSTAERDLLARVRPPVLDIGCGPGRIAAYLATQRVPALGIDIAPAAVLLARARGAHALRRSVFGPLPLSGRWGTAVLLDGNLGIGGDPVALLTRTSELLSPGGRVLCDVEPPGTPSRSLSVRLPGMRGGWQPWAEVGADDLSELAAHAGLRIADLWSAEDRWFAELVVHQL